MNKPAVNRLLNPKSIAVIGASETPGKPGCIVMQNLLKSKARIYPVNPAYETVMHIPAADSIRELPPGIDTAIITLKADAAVTAAEECAAMGCAFIIIVAGGFGVMCADYIDTRGTRADLKMAKLSSETERRLRECTFPFASCSNPVDFTASGNDRMYIDTIEAVLADEGVDLVICIALFSPPGITDALIPMLSETIRTADKPVLVFTEYGPYTEKILLDFYNEGVAGFSSISRVVRAARFLVERGTILDRISTCREDGPIADARSDDKDGSDDLQSAFKNWLKELRIPGKPDELKAKQLLKEAGLVVPDEILLRPGTPKRIPDELPYPCALKVCSPDILHKSDEGGVRLGITRQTIGDEIRRMNLLFPGVPLLVSPMVSYSGPEMILGALPDGTFGAAVMAGAGGILTELYRDTAFRLAPCGRLTAAEMLDELKIAPILSGYRGSNLDKEAMAETISRFSRIASIVSSGGGQIDINPLVWDGSSWVVLDAKVIL